jgi:hypothetical protein
MYHKKIEIAIMYHKNIEIAITNRNIYISCDKYKILTNIITEKIEIAIIYRRIYIYCDKK